MDFVFHYAILLKITSTGSGAQMRYQDSQHNENKVLEKILPVVNLILFLVIAVSLNYLVVSFLFP